MSEMERNKGVLIPEHIDTEDYAEDDFDTLQENGFMVIDGEVYSVKYEVEDEQDCYGFADVTVKDDGTVEFHTYHYNGGGSLEEVIEGAYLREVSR